jgi:hypothetical protein
MGGVCVVAWGGGGEGGEGGGGSSRLKLCHHSLGPRFLVFRRIASHFGSSYAPTTNTTSDGAEPTLQSSRHFNR